MHILSQEKNLPTNEKVNVVLWGASVKALGTAAYYLDFNKIEIISIIDSDQCKKGMLIKEGMYEYEDTAYMFAPGKEIPVITPEEYKDRGNEYLVILTANLNSCCSIYRDCINLLGISEERIMILDQYNYHWIKIMTKMYTNPLIFKTEVYQRGMEYILNEQVKGIKELHNTYMEWIRNIQSNQEEIGIGDYNFTTESLTAYKSSFDIFCYEFNDIFAKDFVCSRLGCKYVEGPYEYGQVKINEQDVIFDLGANIGMFTVLASRKTKNMIYAFEPVSETREVLRRNLKNADHIEIVPFAVGNRNEKIKIDTSYLEDNSGAITINNKDEQNGQTVEIISLDDFVEQNAISNVDFIKADIEGAERFALAGARNILRTMAPKLSICTYHCQDDPEMLEFIIKDANPSYVIEHAYKKIYAYVPQKKTLD